MPQEQLTCESAELFRRGDEARVALEQARRGGAGLRLLTWAAAGGLGSVKISRVARRLFRFAL